MTGKTKKEDSTWMLGCAAEVAFFVASLVCCVAIGMAFGAECGYACVAFVIAALGVFMIAVAKKMKRDLKNCDDGSDRQ